MELIWVWSEQYGTYVDKGGYCDHGRVFFSDQTKTGKLPWSLFDAAVRGYAVVNHKQRKVELALSEANSRENAFFPDKVFMHFRKQFPKYLVLRCTEKIIN